MKENPFSQGINNVENISPQENYIELLRGNVSEPMLTISYKTAVPSLAMVCLVENGCGLIDLPDWQDNREWSGIFNHILLCTRYSQHFANELILRGQKIDPEVVLNGMLVSHTGRRLWDEARWYKDIVTNAALKSKKSNEEIGLSLILGRVPEDVYKLVSSLAYSEENSPIGTDIYNSWEFKITSYVDHTTDKEHKNLSNRMGNFIFRNFFNGRDDKNLRLEEKIGELIQEIVDRETSAETADKMLADLGVKEISDRLLTRQELIKMILKDADTERMLAKIGINPKIEVQMPKWENDLRVRYVKAAASEIRGDRAKIITDAESDGSNWWYKYALAV